MELDQSGVLVNLSGQIFGDTKRQQSVVSLQLYKEHDRTSVKKPMETILSCIGKK